MTTDYTSTDPVGQYTPNVIINQGANKAIAAVNQGTSQATGTLNQGQNQALGYLGNLFGTGQNTISPYVQGSYSTMDSYFDALGISRPSAGFGGYKDMQDKISNYHSSIADIQNQINYVQSQYEQASKTYDANHNELNAQNRQQWAERWQNFVPKLTQTLQQQQSELADVQKQSGQTTDPQAQREGVLNSLRNSPGYQFALGEGNKSIENSAAANGILRSGRTLKALDRFSTGLADQTYQSYVNNLATSLGMTSPFSQQSANLSATQGQLGTGVISNTTNAIAGLQSDQGSSIANIRSNQAGANAAIWQGMQAQSAMVNNANNSGQAYLKGIGG